MVRQTQNFQRTLNPEILTQSFEHITKASEAPLAGLEPSPHVTISVENASPKALENVSSGSVRRKSAPGVLLRTKTSERIEDGKLWRNKLVLVMVGLPARGKVRSSVFLFLFLFLFIIFF